MSKIIIGKKLGMTRVFTERGAEVLTVVHAEPNQVCSVRTVEKDGYNAIRLGSGVRKAKKINKPLAGQTSKLKFTPVRMREFSVDVPNHNVGDTVDVSQFAKDDVVVVTATTKGKGYSGSIKRHGFHRGPMSHGSDHHRAPGSIGSAYPQRVVKGKKMPGQLGNVVSRCEAAVYDTIEKENILLLKGSLPGAKGAWLKIQTK